MKYCCDDFKEAIDESYIWWDDSYEVYEFGKEGRQSVYQMDGWEISYCPFCGAKLK